MEFVFKKPNMDDVEMFRNILKNNRYPGCEFSISNIMLWAEFYHMEYAICEQVLISKHVTEDGKVRLSYPIGAENEMTERRIFDMELEYFEGLGQTPWFGLIEPVMYESIENWYPGRFEVTYERDWADYIYNREKLMNLSGKKLHGKRNHIKRFQEQHPEWTYETLSEENVEACVAMAKNWCRANCCKEDDEKQEEFHLVVRALRNFRQLHMRGGLLRTKEGVVAFTLGSPISADTFDVSFEKAYADIQGAYPMINQQFVLHELQDYVYVNREEDLGVEGLRKAKLSYYPEVLLEKGTCKEKKSNE